MPPGQSKVAHKIDALMEQASEALVQRKYFDCERLAVDALRRAIAALDFDRIARIALPLQEARRQIRDLAVDSGNLVNVNGPLPTGAALTAGMYILSPPRVGVDGRLLREEAVRREIPVLIIVREPTTKQGLWPIVAVGPVTVRARIAPPPPPPPPPAHKSKSRGVKTTGKAKVGHAATENGLPVVTPEWMLLACEALGDEAIDAIAPGLSPIARVLAIADRLETVPDHEKLHQRLEDAAREAAKIPPKKRAAPKPGASREEDGD